MAELRGLFKHWNFRDIQNNILKDQLVHGIADQGNQHQLFAQPDLTFQKTMELAKSVEVAEKNTHELGQGMQLHT